jgi:excisionase family DNA binding protein
MYATPTQNLLYEKYGHAATKKEASEALQVSQITIDRLRAAGKIQAKKIGQKVMIPISEIAKFLEV